MIPPSSQSQSETVPERRVLRESEFAHVISAEWASLARLCEALLGAPQDRWTERQMFLLMRLATDFEGYLDRHGAPANQTFFRLRELVAIVRWLAIGTTPLLQIESRRLVKEQPDPDWAEEKLLPGVSDAVRRLRALMVRTLEALRDEWRRCGAGWPETAQPEDPGVTMAESALARDRHDEDQQVAGEDTAVARFLGRVMRFYDGWDSRARGGRHGWEALQGYMREYCTESLARQFEARAHSLQSEYDTNVANSSEESREPRLREVRGAVTQCLHLLESSTALTHLYERHDLHERHGESRALFEGLVEPEELLDVLVNTCISLAHECLEKGAVVARELLPAFIEQERRVFTLPEGLSLHARPVTLIVKIVAHHGTHVEVEIGGERASAASIMSMLVLVGGHPGEREIAFLGDAAVLDDLELLFEAGLGENGTEALPERLSFLA